MFDLFSFLARQKTSRAPIMRGVLPTLGTLVTLLALSSVIALGLSLWTGALLTLSHFIPLCAQAAAGIAGTALLTFWFQREMRTATLNAREVRSGFHFGESNPINLRKLVDHIVAELNVHFKAVHGDAYVPLQTPRLCVYTDPKPELQVVLGRTPNHAALFFSHGMLDSTVTKYNQKHLAAVIAHRLTQIYYRRGWSSTIAAIGTDCGSTLDSLQEASAWYWRALGWLAGPARFFFFVQKAIERSHFYEAIKTVVAIGRGGDFYEALDVAVAPSLCKQPAYSYLLLDQANRRSKEAYDLGALAWAEDPDTGEDPLSKAIDGIVRETVYSSQELSSSKPRTTRVKEEMRPALKIGQIGKALIAADQHQTVREFVNAQVSLFDTQSLDTLSARLAQKLNTPKDQATGYFEQSFEQLRETPKMYKKVMKVLCQEEVQVLARRERVENAKLYQSIPSASRYAPIGPDGNGVASPRVSRCA